MASCSAVTLPNSRFGLSALGDPGRVLEDVADRGDEVRLGRGIQLVERDGHGRIFASR